MCDPKENEGDLEDISENGGRSMLNFVETDENLNETIIRQTNQRSWVRIGYFFWISFDTFCVVTVRGVQRPAVEPDLGVAARAGKAAPGERPEDRRKEFRHRPQLLLRNMQSENQQHEAARRPSQKYVRPFFVTRLVT